jgi:hypothetical protein
MKTYNKYIKLFEENKIHNGLFQHLIKLKEAALEAASSHSFESGARIIQEFLDIKTNEIKKEMDLLASLGIYGRNFYLNELIYPYYKKFGGEILDSQLKTFDKQEIETKIENLPKDTDFEEDLEELDF